jgi:RNase P/RNase MRP subunit p30
MPDIVLLQGLETSAAEGTIFSGALPNFFSAPDAKAAKQSCRRKNALLHVRSYEVDDGDLIELSRAGGALVFSLSDVLPESGFRRAILLSKMRLALAACRKRGTGVVVCSLAKNANEMRGARELSAFASVLGMSDVERKEAGKNLERLTNPAKVEK